MAATSYAIGLAVGMEYVDGTMYKNTAWTTAVLIKDGTTDVEVVAKAQELSYGSGFGNIKDVLNTILTGHDPAAVTRINIATPQVLDQALSNNLSKVTAVRLCGCATQSLLPFCNIPDDVNEKLKGDIRLLDGGYEFSRDAGANPPIKEVNTGEVLQCIADVSASEYNNVVICGVYSPDRSNQEYQVGQLFNSQNPDLNVTLSHKVVNEIGLLERENTSILNAGLGSSFGELAKQFQATFLEVSDKLTAPFYFVQNEANLVRGDSQAGDPEFPFPVKSFFGVEASTMNSCIVLEKEEKNCMVINIEGRVSTAGMIKNGVVELQTPIIEVAGFPVYKHAVNTVPYNVGMFSKVYNPDSESNVRIGPDCVNNDTDSLVFGGTYLTLLDVAVKKGLIQVGDPSKVNLTDEEVQRVINKFPDYIAALIDSAKESPDLLPVVIVGIGNVLIDAAKPLAGASKVIKPPNPEVATAIGAAVLSDTSLHFAGTVYTPNTDPVEYITHERHVFRHPKSRPRLQSVVNTQVNTHRPCQQRANKAQPGDDVIIEDNAWLIQEIDLEYISVGAGILGSGGGGSPQLGKLMAIDQLNKGKKIRVQVPEWMSDDGSALITAIMGSPGVLIEKYPNGAEGVESVELMKDLYKCGYDINDGSLKWKPAGTVEASTETGVKYIEDFPTVYNSPLVSDKKFEAVMLIESGGLNTMQSLVVGAETDLPIYDCDGQGRSVPNLSMIGPIMYGTPLYPCTLTGSKGEKVVALSTETSEAVEEFFRIQTTEMGYFTAISFPPLTKEVVKSTMVNYTVSKAWRLGKAIADANSAGTDPIQSIIDSENGTVLIRDGKVTSLSQQNVEGFIVGRYTVSDGTKTVTIDFQNENLVVWDGDQAYPDSNEKVLATIPDLIIIVDENGQPLNAEVLYYGVRLTVIAAPCSPLLTSTTALPFIGPRAVGYNFDYKPIAGNPEYRPAKPVPPMKPEPYSK